MWLWFNALSIYQIYTICPRRENQIHSIQHWEIQRLTISELLIMYLGMWDNRNMKSSTYQDKMAHAIYQIIHSQKFHYYSWERDLRHNLKSMVGIINEQHRRENTFSRGKSIIFWEDKENHSSYEYASDNMAPHVWDYDILSTFWVNFKKEIFFLMK